MSQTAALNPDAVAADWRMSPSSVAWPGRTAGLSAAIFSGTGADGLEFRSRPDPLTHTLSVEFSPFLIDLEIDGHVVHSGPVETGDMVIVRAGGRPAARVTGDWRVLQFYLPRQDLIQTAEELGAPSSEAQALELTTFGFRKDGVIYRVARRLNAGLKRGDTPSRLELDEMALVLSERLVRRHSSVTLPRASRSTCLSKAETRIVLELLAYGRDTGLAELAALLSRPPGELREGLRELLRKRAALIQALRRRTPLH